MPNFYLCLLLAGFWTFAQCHHVPAHHVGDENIPHLKIAPGNADFALKFYKEAASGAARNNVFFSPLSISTAFSMLSLGAKSNTLRQLLSGLEFNLTDISEHEIHEGFHHLLHILNNPNSEIEINIGNTLFIDEKVKPLKKFLNDAKHLYKADISHANFENPEEAMNQINSYIKGKTHGKLEDFIKGLDPEAVMVLLNYNFMKAYWRNPFNYEVTQEEDFFVDKHIAVRVPMMNRDAFFSSYHDTDLSCQVVELPYKGSASALFILPDPGKMKQVEDALNKDVLLKWLHSLRPRRMHLYLPRFSINGKYVLKGMLRRQGITDVFTDNADLSGITRETNLKVSKSIHQAYINVHENGTEAAATTVIEITPHSNTPVVRFNSPFLMAITEHDSKCILFMGKVNNPAVN